MTETTTVTVRVPVATKEKLDRLAEITRRSRAFLAAEAIAGYVEQEMAIVGAIQRGLEDKGTGRTVPHKQAMGELRRRVKKAAARTQRKSA